MKKYNHSIFLCLFLIGISYSLLHAEFNEVDFENSRVQLLRTEKMRFCYITFVKIKGKEFLVKQKIPLRKLLGVVRDAITAHIAEDFGIAHKVGIIPAGKKFPGKYQLSWPATIHTIAPGKTIKGQISEYDRMNIKQAEIGFRKDMLVWMAKHPVLPMVVALDTFLCNHDRHRGNLFYHAKTDSFCAIDMDSSFKYNLCALACNNFTEMLHERNLRLNHKEIKALELYKEYLEFLIQNHSPEDTISMYNYFADKAGFVEGSELYTQNVALELDRNRRMIRESYKDAQRLIGIMDEVIKKAKKDKTRVGYF